MKYYKTEEVIKISSIKHPVVRESLKLLKYKKNFEMVHTADLPAQSGLGASSSFTVGLLNSLYRLNNLKINKKDLANISIFLEQKKILNKNLMLLCGFEKFENLYVRIDILERLFLMIFNTKSEHKIKEIKLIPEMLNLLGCNKENFVKLIKKMNYKTYEKNNNLYFKYIPFKKIIKKDNSKKGAVYSKTNFFCW